MLPMRNSLFKINAIWIFYLLLYPKSAAANLQLNASIYHVPRKPVGADVSLCIRKVLTEITKHKEYISDVVLLDVNDALQINKLDEMKNVLFLTRTFSWTENKQMDRIYVATANDFEEFNNGITSVMKNLYFNPRANFIIVLENFNRSSHKEMIKFLVFNNVYNVTILAREEDDAGYKMYTFQSPIHPCNHDEKMIVISHCSSYENGSFIFPRIGDISGCSFDFMTYNLFPLINLDNPEEEGIEQRFLRYFEKYYNVKIRLIPYSKTDKLGQIIGNFTYTDILLKVEKNKAEGAIGGYFLDSVSFRRFAFTYPISVDHMKVVLARSNFEDGWQAFFHQDAVPVLILVVFLFIVFTMAANILSLFPAQHNNLSRNMLIVFGYFMNKITIYKFKSGPSESLLIGSFLFCIFILPYTMQSYMWSIKTHPLRVMEPKLFEQVQGQRKLILTSEWLREGIYKDRQDCESILECLKLVRDRKDKMLYTFVTEETYETFKWMLADEQCELGLYKLKEPISILLRTIVLRRGSVLERWLNDFSFNVIAGGFIDKHYNEIILQEHLKCKPKYIPAEVPLNMDEFKGPYNVLFGGIIVSTVIFLYEILVN